MALRLAAGSSQERLAEKLEERIVLRLATGSSQRLEERMALRLTAGSSKRLAEKPEERRM
jgi:hypothetical protein